LLILRFTDFGIAFVSVAPRIFKIPKSQNPEISNSQVVPEFCQPEIC
jgi:hypothetical protein